MSDRPTASTITDPELDQLHAELADAREQLRLVDSMRQQNLDSAAAAIQLAEQAEARLQHLQASSEAAGTLLTRTTDERDQLRTTLREVLAMLLPTRNAHGTIVGYEPPYPITPAAVARWRATLPETACTCGEPTGDDEDAVEARKGWLHSRSCAAVKGATGA